MTDFRRTMSQETGPQKLTPFDRPDEPVLLSGDGLAGPVSAGDSGSRLAAGYWKVKAVRAASESEVQAREIKRLRQWMDELQREVEDLRHIQQKSEESIYEQLMDIPTYELATSAALREVPVKPPALEIQSTIDPLRAQISTLQGEVDGLRSQVDSLEAELQTARQEREAEQTRASALDEKLAARMAAEESRGNLAVRIEALLADQEKHMTAVESKLSRLDAQLIAARDAERVDQAPPPEPVPFDATAGAVKREKSGGGWKRIQSLFTASEI